MIRTATLPITAATIAAVEIPGERGREKERGREAERERKGEAGRQGGRERERGMQAGREIMTAP